MDKVTKGSVNYRMATGQTRQCSNCAMFHPRGFHGRNGSCDLVEGLILPQAVCDKWVPIEKEK